MFVTDDLARVQFLSFFFGNAFGSLEACHETPEWATLQSPEPASLETLRGSHHLFQKSPTCLFEQLPPAWHRTCCSVLFQCSRRLRTRWQHSSSLFFNFLLQHGTPLWLWLCRSRALFLSFPLSTTPSLIVMFFVCFSPPPLYPFPPLNIITTNPHPKNNPSIFELATAIS